MLQANDYVMVKETGKVFKVDHVCYRGYRGYRVKFALTDGTYRQYTRDELHKLSTEELNKFIAGKR